MGHPASDDNVVLYVEDNTENWEVTQLHLGRRFRMLWARDDVEACRLISTHHDRLSTILMDIELKGSTLDGIALTKLVRGKLPRTTLPDYASTVPVLNTPIFFVTAHSARYAEAELTEVGGNKLITKPVNFAELSRALTKVRLRELDALPAHSLLKASSNSDLEQMLQLLTTDPAFSRRLLVLAEGGSCGVRADAATPADLLRKLGATAVHPMALALAIADLVPDGRAGQVLFGNALRRAVICRELAQHTGWVPPPEAFAAGLLLESGLLARGQHDAQGALEVARSPAAARTVRERAAGELEHPERSAQIARDWALPAEWIDAVQTHHAAKPATDPLTRLCWLTEKLAAVFEAGDYRQNHAAALQAAESLHVDERVVDAVLDRCPAQTERAAADLGRRIPHQLELDELLADSNPSLADLHSNYEALVRTLASLVDQKDALTERLRQANARLSRQAATDSLTGLANRRALADELDRSLAFADRDGSWVGLVMLDIDHFKNVNDTCGHLIGDEVLRKLSELVATNLRTSDFAARYGGEEVAILLPRTTLEQAQMIAERLHQAITDDPYLRSVEGLAVTASLGVAAVGGPGCAALGSELIGTADRALYAAKGSGRNRVVVAEPLVPPGSPRS